MVFLQRAYETTERFSGYLTKDMKAWFKKNGDGNMNLGLQRLYEEKVRGTRKFRPQATSNRGRPRKVKEFTQTQEVKSVQKTTLQADMENGRYY